jgi:ElaA protein
MDLRRTVFIDEQHVPEADEWDGLDDKAVHFLVVEEGRPVGTARMLLQPEGLARAGRVAVAQDRRGMGIGRLLMGAVHEAARTGGAARVSLGAQATAIPFYQRLGYAVDGPVFDDAGIPHRHMERIL